MMTSEHKLQTIRKRAAFLTVKEQGQSVGTSGLVLQWLDRQDGDDTVRLGVTATKKLGNAVVRNRAKRRLRALFREVFDQSPDLIRAGHDMVLIARFSTAKRDYDRLRKDLHYALHQVVDGA